MGFRNCRPRGRCRGATVSGRRRETAALSKRPREEKRGLRRSRALRPVVGLRRCQGGGEAPSRYRNAPGRRRGGSEGLGRCARLWGCDGAREEERHRRAIETPQGGGEGAPKVSGVAPGCGVATVPGRRRGTAALSKRPREEERGLRRSGHCAPCLVGGDLREEERGRRRNSGAQGGGESPSS